MYALWRACWGTPQPSTTLDIYSHAFDKNKKLAQEKLAEAMGL